MSEPKPVPPIVTKRNEFTSIPMLVDDALGRFPEEGRIITRDEMVRIMTQFCERVSRDCMYAYQKGAERGIEQAHHLMNDPDYYDTVKERRRRSNQRYAEDQEKQRIERIERDHDPEYRAKTIADFRKWIEDGKQHQAQLEARLTAYLAMCEEPPKLVRLPIPPGIDRNWQIKGFGQTIDSGIPVVPSMPGLHAVPDAPVPVPDTPGTPRRVK